MKSKNAYKEVLEFMTRKIYGDNDECCFNKSSLNEKNNKLIDGYLTISQSDEILNIYTDDKDKL